MWSKMRQVLRSSRAMAATTRNIPDEAARWQLAVAERVGRVEFDGEEVCPPHERGQRPPRTKGNYRCIDRIKIAAGSLIARE